MIPSTSDNSELNIKSILLKYTKHWKWFVLSVLMFFLMGKIYLRYSQPIYSANAKILIKSDEGSGNFSEMAAFQDLSMFSGGNNNIDNEIQILKSRSLIEKTIKEGKFNINYNSEGRIKSTDSYGNCPIEIVFDEKNEKILKKDTIFKIKIIDKNKFEILNLDNEIITKSEFGKINISKKLGNFKINKKNIYNSLDKLIELKNDDVIQVSTANISAIVDSFLGRLNINTLTKFADVLELNLNDQVSKRAIDFLNLHVSIYNREAINDKNLISNKTAKFINERLDIITKELSGVENDVEKYKNQNNIIDIPAEAELNLKTATAVKQENLSVTTQLNVTNMMMEYLSNSKSEVIPSNIIPENAAAAEMVNQYNAVVLERSRILKSSTPSNPFVLRLDDKINQFKENINTTLNQYKKGLQLKNNKISGLGNSINSRLNQVPKQEREFRGIERQRNIKEELYLYLFKKREETNITLAATEPKSKIVDLGYSSNIPISPKKQLIQLLCLIMGLIVPISIIYIKDLLDTKVKNLQDILTAVTIPFIGDVPHSVMNSEIMKPTSRTSSAEAIRIIRTNLEFLINNINDKKAKTIFLTSTLPKEGKTFIAVNLAATIAISSKKTLLIGLDIRNPKLDEYMKLPNKGVTNFLTSKNASISDYIITHKDYTHLDILPAGIIPPNPAELLMNAKLEEMFETLKVKYEYIVVDTAPVSLVTDTLLISKFADAFIYVVRANYLEKQYLKLPQALYLDKKLPNMSILLNDTDTSEGFGYGYGQYIQVEKPWYKKFFASIPFIN